MEDSEAEPPISCSAMRHAKSRPRRRRRRMTSLPHVPGGLSGSDMFMAEPCRPGMGRLRNPQAADAGGDG